MGLSELMGEGRKASLRREKVQPVSDDCKMRLISEVLPHFHAFCNWAWRDKKPNYLNSVSVFIAPGR